MRSQPLSFFNELKQRNVFKVGLVYLVVGWALIQVADLMAPQMNLPEWTPRMITFVVMLGFPVALVMAWALELSPEGVKKAGGSNLPIYVFAVILAGFSFYWFFDSSAKTTTMSTGPDTGIAASADQTGPPSIAVIPFENMSGSDANDPFTVGIHDDLLTQLSKINSLRTISRTSVLRYKGSAMSIREIGAELSVASILEGGVQRVGNNVRINVQLIDSATDVHLWAETYDRELSAANIFAIQSEIATAIATALKVTLTTVDQHRLASTPTDNLQALEAYFSGKQLADIRSEENLKKSLEFFDLAISLDPNFALAYAGRSYAWLLLPEYDAALDTVLSRRISKEAADKALSIEPDLPEGLTMRAWIQLRNYEWGTAEATLNRALQIHPSNVDAMHWLSHILSWQGRHDEALAVAQKAVDIDPLSPLMSMNLSYIQMDAGLYELSIQTRDRTLHIKTDMFEQVRNMWLTFLRAGRYTDAVEALDTWARGTGRNAESAAKLSQLLSQHKKSGELIELPADILADLALGTENLAQVYAAAGDRGNSLTQLMIALHERAGSRSVLSMRINPLYDFFREDPLFVKLMQEANLTP